MMWKFEPSSVWQFPLFIMQSNFKMLANFKAQKELKATKMASLLKERNLRSCTVSCFFPSALLCCTKGAKDTARMSLLSHVHWPVLVIWVSCRNRPNSWLSTEQTQTWYSPSERLQRPNVYSSPPKKPLLKSSLKKAQNFPLFGVCVLKKSRFPGLLSRSTREHWAFQEKSLKTLTGAQKVWRTTSRSITGKYFCAIYLFYLN